VEELEALQGEKEEEHYKDITRLFRGNELDQGKGGSQQKEEKKIGPLYKGGRVPDTRQEGDRIKGRRPDRTGGEKKKKSRG